MFTQGNLIDEHNGEFLLASDIIYTSQDIQITIPAGFETDILTRPPIFRSFVPQTGRYTLPCILHDWLYSTKYTGKINKQTADKLLLKTCIECGVPPVKAFVIYMAVVLFGNKHYKKTA